MSIDDLVKVITSFINQEPLNNIQISFINKIAKVITQELNDKHWNVIMRVTRNMNLPSLFKYILYKIKPDDADKLPNDIILIGISISNWITMLDDILDETNSHNDEKKSQERVNNYIAFINKIKECYKQGYINNNEYISLLNWLVYYNVYEFFEPISDGLLVTHKDMPNTPICE